MLDIEVKSEQVLSQRSDYGVLPLRARDSARARTQIIPILVTLSTVAMAALFTYLMWQVYMAAPWTRDGTVRAYVVTMAPEVAGRIVELPVTDNQFVRKGDLLMVVDPTNYAIAVRQAEAAVDQANAVAKNARVESDRRQKQTNLSVSAEEQQTFAPRAPMPPISWPWLISTRREPTSSVPACCPRSTAM